VRGAFSYSHLDASSCRPSPSLRKLLYLKIMTDSKKRRNPYKKPPASDSDTEKAHIKFCVAIVKKYIEDEHGQAFAKPVLDMWKVEELPGYFEMIKEPMDFTTILDNLENKDKYVCEETKLFDYRKFADDVFLVFDNCYIYNEKGTDIHDSAVHLENVFQRRLKYLPKPKKPSEDDASDEDDADSSVEKEGAGKSRRRSSTARTSRRAVDNSEDDDDESMEDVENGGRTDDKNMEDDEDGDDEEANGSHAKDDSDDKNSNEDTGETGGNRDEEGGDSIKTLKEEMNRLAKLKAQSEKVLAEIELETNIVEMSEDERKKLRDEIEDAPWETVEAIGRILRTYVNDALTKFPKNDDPEFVTIEMSSIDAKVLREVEKILKPNDRVSEEAKKYIL